MEPTAEVISLEPPLPERGRKALKARHHRWAAEQREALADDPVLWALLMLLAEYATPKGRITILQRAEFAYIGRIVGLAGGERGVREALNKLERRGFIRKTAKLQRNALVRRLAELPKGGRRYVLGIADEERRAFKAHMQANPPPPPTPEQLQARAEAHRRRKKNHRQNQKLRLKALREENALLGS